MKKKKEKKFLYSIRYVVYIVDTCTFLGLDELDDRWWPELLNRMNNLSLKI